MAEKGFLAELTRRRVLPVAGAYIAVAWLLTEIASFFLGQAGAPGWTIQLLAILIVVGFPIALFLAWVIQVGPDGKRALDSSTSHRKTIASALTLGALATCALAWFVIPRFDSAPDYQPIPNSLAILPLVGADATPNTQTVGETLVVALQEGLGKSRALNRITLTFEQRPDDLAAFGRQYRVASILTGELQQEPGGLEVTMQQIDVGSGRVNWERSLAWDATRIREIATGIANQALETMRLESISQESFAGTQSKDAYDALLSGFRYQYGMRLDNLPRSMDEFQRAIDLDPSYVDAYVGLAQSAWIYRRGGPPDLEAVDARARQAIAKALELEPDSPDAISMAGLWAESEEMQIQAYRRALELNPDHEMSYFRLAHIMWRKGELEEAERLVRKALEYYPTGGNFTSDLGGILWDQGRHEEAIATVEHAIDLNPGNRQHYIKLANWSSGDPVKRMALLRKAYELDPNWGYLAARVALVYADMQAHDEAVAWARHAAELNASNGAIWDWAALALDRVGEAELAREYGARALGKIGTWELTLMDQGAREIAAGNPAQAIENWKQLYPLIANRDNPVMDDRYPGVGVYFAATLLRAGEREWALDLLSRVLASPAVGGFEEHWARVLLQHTDESLRTMRDMLEQFRTQYWLLNWWKRPEYDFLRDDLEFRQMVATLPNPDIAEARGRVRQMECNGELPAAPVVEFTPVCH